jgi:hypothetical protein
VGDEGSRMRGSSTATGAPMLSKCGREDRGGAFRRRRADKAAMIHFH